MCLAVILALPSVLPPLGNAAWVYDTKGGASGMWANELGSYNGGATSCATITTIFTYGGDMEWYPSMSPPGQTYFAQQSQEAAVRYGALSGVEHVVAVVDGRMDGGQPYSPDLSKLTEAQAREWADTTASVYCSFDTVDGLQIDLEPINSKYLPHLLVFLERLGQNLASAERKCVDAKHPEGRTLTTFGFAAAATPEVWKALGPNGYFTVSGYDLAQTPPGTPNTVAEYTSALQSAVDTISSLAAASNGSFIVGIPAAASTHEFANYTTKEGVVTQGHPQLEYVKAAVGVLKSSLAANPLYLGAALWGFSSEMAYPPHSNNLFTPGTPFVDSAEKAFLQKRLCTTAR